MTIVWYLLKWPIDADDVMIKCEVMMTNGLLMTSIRPNSIVIQLSDDDNPWRSNDDDYWRNDINVIQYCQCYYWNKWWPMTSMLISRKISGNVGGIENGVSKKKSKCPSSAEKKIAYHLSISSHQWRKRSESVMISMAAIVINV